MSEGAMNAACVSQENFPVGLFCFVFSYKDNSKSFSIFFS